MATFPEFLSLARKFLQEHTMSEFRDFWSDLRQIAQSEGKDPLSYIHECEHESDHVCVSRNRATRTHASTLIRRFLTCSSCNECTSCHPTCEECEECMENCTCYTCEGCDRRYTEGNTDVCSHCNNCRQRCCQCIICECGADIENVGGCSSEDDNCDHCSNCCECSSSCANVEFFSSETPHFHNSNRLQHKHNPTSRYISAEIEVAECGSEGYKVTDVVRKWRGGIVEDGSLPEGGFEINTAPASGDMYVKQIQEITAALDVAKGKVNKKCGLHVHIDARDFTYYDIRRLMMLYAHIEHTLFQMVPESRQESGYCDPCGHKYRNAVEKGIVPYKKVKEDIATVVYGQKDTRHERTSKYNGARYAALNVHSWFYRGTVECRMFNGTTNAHKITQWGILWATILDFAQKHTDKEVDAMSQLSPYDSLMRVCGNSATLKAFVNERRANFGHMPQSEAA